MDLVTEYLVKKALCQVHNQSLKSARTVLKDHLNEHISEICKISSEIAGEGKRITPLVIREAIWIVENGGRTRTRLATTTRDQVRPHEGMVSEDI